MPLLALEVELKCPCSILAVYLNKRIQNEDIFCLKIFREELNFYAFFAC
jgi:hypothetical protein